MVKKFFDFVLFYGLGVCLNLVVRSNQIIQEKKKALEQHTKVIERNRLARDLHDTKALKERYSIY